MSNVVYKNRPKRSRLAEILASGSFPSLNTAKTWHAGNTPFYGEYGDEYANRTKALVESNGGRMGPHDDYIPWAAKFPGDPDAVVHGHDRPREQISEAVQRQQANLEARANQPPVALAEDLIDDEIYLAEQEHPEVKQLPKKEKENLRRKIVEDHAYSPPKGD